jgi:hypothetical protein
MLFSSKILSILARCYMDGIVSLGGIHDEEHAPPVMDNIIATPGVRTVLYVLYSSVLRTYFVLYRS